MLNNYSNLSQHFLENFRTGKTSLQSRKPTLGPVVRKKTCKLSPVVLVLDSRGIFCHSCAEQPRGSRGSPRTRHGGGRRAVHSKGTHHWLEVSRLACLQSMNAQGRNGVSGEYAAMQHVTSSSGSSRRTGVAAIVQERGSKTDWWSAPDSERPPVSTCDHLRPPATSCGHLRLVSRQLDHSFGTIVSDTDLLRAIRYCIWR